MRRRIWVSSFPVPNQGSILPSSHIPQFQLQKSCLWIKGGSSVSSVPCSSKSHFIRGMVLIQICFPTDWTEVMVKVRIAVRTDFRITNFPARGRCFDDQLVAFFLIPSSKRLKMSFFIQKFSGIPAKATIMGGCCRKPKEPIADSIAENAQPQIQQLHVQQSQTQQRRTRKNQHNDGFDNFPFTGFFYSDLVTATNNFSSNEIISSEDHERSYNIVYKGHLRNNLGLVAIKKFMNNAWPDPDYFTVDAERVGTLNHKRIVKLVGYCSDEKERILVAEYLPSETLAKRLFNQKSETLEWSMRLRVAYQIAEALEYIYSSHFLFYSNLSADTVLFDKDDDACLSCFGLVMDMDYSKVIREGVDHGSMTYRFGTILLNLLTGIPISLSHALEIIKGKDITELMDPKLKGKFSKESAYVVLKLASECLQYEERGLITKEHVATLETLLTKTKILSAEMSEMAKATQ